MHIWHVVEVKNFEHNFDADEVQEVCIAGASLCPTSSSCNACDRCSRCSCNAGECFMIIPWPLEATVAVPRGIAGNSIVSEAAVARSGVAGAFCGLKSSS